MSNVNTRVEQALIGAMLTAEPLPREFEYLRTEDFGHHVLRQIHTAIVELSDECSVADLPDVVADRVKVPGVDAEWLRELRDTSPPATHLAAYARMAQVSAFRRDMLREGQRIAATVATGRASGQTMKHLDQLAGALARQAEIFSAFTAVDTPLTLRASGQVRAENEPGPAAVTRSHREDHLLADLLARPEQVRDVARIVPAETFTSPQRREVYETVTRLVEGREPVDEVIVLWEMERQRASTSARIRYPEYRDKPTEPDAAYLARLAATTVIVGTAITIGHQLVVDDVKAQLTSGAIAAQVRQNVEIDGLMVAPATSATQIYTALTPSPQHSDPQPRIGM